MELVVDSPGKRKTNSENQQCLEMKIKEMIGNYKLNAKVNIISQVKQISYELIQDNNYHTNQTKPGHEQIEESQPIRIPETDIEWKDNDNWKSNQEIRKTGKYNITYTTENIKNNRKGSTEKYGKNIRVQHFEERIEQVMEEDTRSIRTRAKLKKNMIMWERKYQIANYKKNMDRRCKKKGKSRRNKV